MSDRSSYDMNKKPHYLFLDHNQPRRLSVHGFELNYLGTTNTKLTKLGIQVESLWQTEYRVMDHTLSIREAKLTWWPGRANPYTVIADLIQYLHIQNLIVRDRSRSSRSSRSSKGSSEALKGGSINKAIAILSDADQLLGKNIDREVRAKAESELRRKGLW